MKTILIIERDSYRRNTVTRKMVDHGFLVFDVKDQLEAIDIVLSLAETSPIHYLLCGAGMSLHPTLLKFCELKFGKSPKILFQSEMLEKTSDELLA
jgi:hypothetical protein